MGQHETTLLDENFTGMLNARCLVRLQSCAVRPQKNCMLPEITLTAGSVTQAVPGQPGSTLGFSLN